jgi:hypothetical protein
MLAAPNQYCYIPNSGTITYFECPDGYICHGDRSESFDVNTYSIFQQDWVSNSGAPWMFSSNPARCQPSSNILNSGNSVGDLVELDPCQLNTDCASGICTNHLCVGKPLKSSCTKNEQCTAGTHCDSTTNKCIQNYLPGALCDSSKSQCQEGYICNGALASPICTQIYSLDNGQSASSGLLCKSRFSISSVCEDLIMENQNCERFVYDVYDSYLCNYSSSITHTSESIESVCMCNPNGNGFDLCPNLISTSKPVKALNLLMQKMCSYGCPKGNECNCSKIPNKVYNQVLLAKYALYGVDITNYRCLHVNLYEDNSNDFDLVNGDKEFASLIRNEIISEENEDPYGQDLASIVNGQNMVSMFSEELIELLHVDDHREYSLSSFVENTFSSSSTSEEYSWTNNPDDSSASTDDHKPPHLKIKKNNEHMDSGDLNSLLYSFTSDDLKPSSDQKSESDDSSSSSSEDDEQKHHEHRDRHHSDDSSSPPSFLFDKRFKRKHHGY